MAKDILELQAGALLGIANQDMERVRGMIGGLLRRLHDAMKAKEVELEGSEKVSSANAEYLRLRQMVSLVGGIHTTLVGVGALMDSAVIDFMRGCDNDGGDADESGEV